jgi:hypothetical protein
MITGGKEIYMSRPSKFLAVAIVVVFLLACSFISQPVRDAENLAKTAEAMGSALPAGTLEALPSLVPAFETNIPDIGNVFNPQGTPVQEWKGIPIMPQATAGQEFPKNNSYSFKATATIKEVQDFYSQKLTALGWEQPFDLPAEGDAALMTFKKGSSQLAIVITSSEDACIVVLTLS